MRAFVNAKAVIIGMGFLMEYIFPCWKNAMGAKVSENILAVTADAHDLEGKQQRMGIRVSAVFMGEDSSAGAAAQIYGKNMARIRGMDQLARAAGRLIQNEIRELGD